MVYPQQEVRPCQGANFGSVQANHLGVVHRDHRYINVIHIQALDVPPLDQLLGLDGPWVEHEVLHSVTLQGTQALEFTKCKVVFGGATVTPVQLKAQMEEAVNMKKKIPMCQNSMGNLTKVMLLGQRLPERVYLWRNTVLEKEEDYYGAANADLQEVTTL
ncbi:MAG: hypothetical protein Q9207_007669 [Kuettlingeria erythrocarpa]